MGCTDVGVLVAGGVVAGALTGALGGGAVVLTVSGEAWVVDVAPV